MSENADSKGYRVNCETPGCIGEYEEVPICDTCYHNDVCKIINQLERELSTAKARIKELEGINIAWGKLVEVSQAQQESDIERIKELEDTLLRVSRSEARLMHLAEKQQKMIKHCSDCSHLMNGAYCKVNGCDEKSKWEAM